MMERAVGRSHGLGSEVWGGVFLGCNVVKVPLERGSNCAFADAIFELDKFRER